jgi:hypothetical protein
MSTRPKLRVMKSTARGILFLLTVIGVLSGTAVTAHAAPIGSDYNPYVIGSGGCGNFCDGWNPATFKVVYNGVKQTCADYAVTLANANGGAGGPVVELRYSARCRTSWSRVVNSNYRPEIKSYSGSTLRAYYIGNVIGGGNYSVMVNNAYPLVAEAWAVIGPTSIPTPRV